MRSESLTLKSRMREICTSGSVGALGRNPQGDPTIDTAGEFSDRVVDIQRRFYASPPDGPPATSSASEKYRYRPWYRRWYHLRQETRCCEFASSIDIGRDIACDIKARAPQEPSTSSR